MIFILLTMVFLLLRVMPGDPVLAMLGGRVVTPELLEEYRAKWGFDKPLIVRYGEYLSGVVRGDFGRSSRSGKPVLEELFRRFSSPPDRDLPGRADHGWASACSETNFETLWIRDCAGLANRPAAAARSEAGLTVARAA